MMSFCLCSRVIFSDADDHATFWDSPTNAVNSWGSIYDFTDADEGSIKLLLKALLTYAMPVYDLPKQKK